MQQQQQQMQMQIMNNHHQVQNGQLGRMAIFTEIFGKLIQVIIMLAGSAHQIFSIALSSYYAYTGMKHVFGNNGFFGNSGVASSDPFADRINNMWDRQFGFPQSSSSSQNPVVASTVTKVLHNNNTNQQMGMGVPTTSSYSMPGSAHSTSSSHHPGSTTPTPSRLPARSCRASCTPPSLDLRLPS